MASHQALLIIDYTNDFVADGGALTCGQPGQALARQPNGYGKRLGLTANRCPYPA